MEVTREPDAWKGTYYVYKCLEPGTHLPEDEQLPGNEHFVSGKHNLLYGDMFVFRLEKLSRSRGAVYGKLNKRFEVVEWKEESVARELLYGFALGNEYEVAEEKGAD